MSLVSAWTFFLPRPGNQTEPSQVPQLSCMSLGTRRNPDEFRDEWNNIRDIMNCRMMPRQRFLWFSSKKIPLHGVQCILGFWVIEATSDVRVEPLQALVVLYCRGGVIWVRVINPGFPNLPGTKNDSRQLEWVEQVGILVGKEQKHSFANYENRLLQRLMRHST